MRIFCLFSTLTLLLQYSHNNFLIYIYKEIACNLYRSQNHSHKSVRHILRIRVEDPYQCRNDQREHHRDDDQHPMRSHRTRFQPLTCDDCFHDDDPDRYSWSSLVTARKASSRLSVTSDSSCTTAPLPCASSPTSIIDIPVTSAPSVSATTLSIDASPHAPAPPAR